MLFKVGDIVTVRKDISTAMHSSIGREYFHMLYVDENGARKKDPVSDCVVSEMTELEGQKVIITEADYKYKCIIYDSGSNTKTEAYGYWTDEMFEEAFAPPTLNCIEMLF